MSSENGIDVLVAEYSAVRQELRMIAASMDTGLTTMVLLAGGLVSVSASLKDERVLFAIPTVMFFLCIGQLMRAITANVLGTYCQAIERRLRERCGSDKIVMNWEGSKLWMTVGHPGGVVWMGFACVGLMVLLIFSVLAYRAYHFWKPTLAVHVLEVFLLASYAWSARKWNLVSTREKWTSAILSQGTAGGDLTLQKDGSRA